jgi:8-oxo-dGTP pyrophosphatase MutT (NUDIX family)
LRGALLPLDVGLRDPADDEGRVPAAVLVPLFVPDGSSVDGLERLHIVLIRRHPGLSVHAGEIAFPGGRREAGDGSLLDTALREAHEEIGLAPPAVAVLGALQPTATRASNYAVHPFVGLIPPGAVWRLSADEVDAVVEAPLADVRAGRGQGEFVRRGRTLRSETFTVGGEVAWGATARILSDLLARLDAAAA